MKNALKQTGKAICYLMFYLWLQVAVTLVAMVVWLIYKGIQMADGSDTAQVEAYLTDLMQEQTELVNAITPWVLIGCMILTLLGLWLFFLIRKKKFLQEVELRRFPLKDVPGVVLAAVGLYLLVVFGLPYLPFSEELWESYAESSEGLAGTSLLLFFSNVIAAPVVEEIIFRGLMFGRMRKAMPVWLAALLSSLAFAVMHGQFLWMTYTFLLAMVSCLALYRTKSLYSSLFIHMFFNLFGSVLSFWASGIPDAFGPVLALAGGVMLIAGVVLLWPRQKTDAIAVSENAASLSNENSVIPADGNSTTPADENGAIPVEGNSEIHANGDV